MAQKTRANFSWPRLRRSLRRFPRHVGHMSLLILLIAIGEVIALWWGGAVYIAKGTPRRASAVQFTLSADGRWAASQITLERAEEGSRLESAVLLHDMHRMELPRRLDLGRVNLRDSAISPSAKHLAFSTDDGKVFIQGLTGDLQSAEVLVDIPRDWYVQLAWSPDNRMLAASGMNLVHVWSMDTRKLLHSFPHGGYTAPSISFSDDGKSLISIAPGKYLIWRVASGELAWSHPSPFGTEIAGIAVSSDGRLAAFACHGGLCVCRCETGQCMWQVDPSMWRCLPVAFSADDSLVANVEQDPSGDRSTHRIVLRDAHTGREIGMLDGHTDHIFGIKFAPNGHIISWDQAGLVIEWDVEKRRELRRFSSLEWVTANLQSRS